MLVPHTNFPVRPSIQKGESLAGYICRFHAANGHRMPSALYVALQALYRGSPGKAAMAFEIVKSVVGNLATLDRTQWFGCTAIESRSRNWRMPTCSSAGFCPACLREQDFHFALWELPLVQDCPVHKIVLLIKCPLCQKPLSWSMIRPSWRCRCGQAIVNMALEPASKAAVAIARCLAGADDIELPNNFRVRLEEPIYEGYCLNDVYEGLEWVSDLRNVFLKSGDNPRKASNCQRRFIGRAWPSAWAVKLLIDSPEQTVQRLLRVVRAQFRANDRMVCFIENSESLNSRIIVPQAKRNRGVFEQKIHWAIEHILSEYSPKLPVSSVALYNPRFSIERRTKNLAQFVVWWSQLCKRIENLDPEIQSYQRNIVSLSSFCNQLQVAELVGVLNNLIDAALQQTDMEAFRALWYWWRIPEALRELTEPSEVLSQIGSHLMTIPDYEARFVCSLVQLAREVQR